MSVIQWGRLKSSRCPSPLRIGGGGGICLPSTLLRDTCTFMCMYYNMYTQIHTHSYRIVFVRCFVPSHGVSPPADVLFWVDAVAIVRTRRENLVSTGTRRRWRDDDVSYRRRDRRWRGATLPRSVTVGDRLAQKSDRHRPLSLRPVSLRRRIYMQFLLIVLLCRGFGAVTAAAVEGTPPTPL